MAVELDYMENYTNDGEAQAAYVTNAASAILDQETTANDIGPLGDVANVEYRLANKIVVAAPVIISQVKFTFGASGGSPSGNVTCRIETNSGSNLPSGILAHANATKAIAVTPSAENTWDFTDFDLSAETYWVVLTCDNQDTNDRWLISMNFGISPNGKGARSDNGVWAALIDRTFTYKIYECSLQSFSSTTKVQGTYSLKGIAIITDSLNKTLTCTVDPTIDLSGIDENYFYIRASRTGAHIKVGIHDAGGTTTEKTYTVIQANTWELVTWDISGVADGNKDAIDSIIITILNADVNNTFFLDYFYGAEDMVLTLEGNLALLESMVTTYPPIILSESLALLESLPALEHGLTLTELLALLESETADVSSLLTESVALLESLPGLGRFLTLTESLALLEDLTDALWDDDSWEAYLSGQLVNKAIIYFEHEGTDYSSYLADVATIKRSAELTSGIATCILSNIAQTWNLFLSDKTEIGSLAEVGIKASPALGFTNKTELFTGKVDDVAYIDAEATLRLRDKLVSTLEKRLGNGENPVEYLTPQNPADLAWELLVTQGGLDSTATTANTDIDYTSWSSWKADCTTLKYSLKARFTGHYITSALVMIADQTDSYVWMGGDGKFYFKRPIPPFAPGGTLPEYGRDDCLQIDASLTKENLINSYRVRYGWELDIQDWDGSYLAEDETSKSEYGTYPGVEEDKVVWHADLDSATEHGDRVVDKNKQPLTKITITSTLKGIFLSLGDTILVTEVLKNFFPIYARVVNIENIDITKGLVRFACRDISDEQIAAFVLDDVYWGLLDQAYNPMM